MPRRLFFALWPERALAQRMASVAASTEARLTHVADLHLTVLFLGQVAESKLADLMEGAGLIRNPVILQPLVRLEFWRGPKTLCLVGAPVQALVQLRDSLVPLAGGVGLAVDREPREFRPHVTVGRAVRAGVPHVSAERAPLVLHAERFCLADSAPRGDGTRYQVLASWPLEAHSAAPFEQGRTR